VARAHPVSRHARRILGRIALAATIALTGGVGLTLSAPAPASAASCVYISGARFDAAGNDLTNLNGEYVKITNRCSKIISVTSWKVKNSRGTTYTFPTTRMGKGTIYLHSGKGTNRPGHRYWGRTATVWKNSGTETAYLFNKSGTLVSKLTKVMSSTSTSAWSTPFGSRPSSKAISLRDCRDVTISNKTFRDLGDNVIAIRLENCTNVTIRAVDFINVAEGVYALNSRNIKVIDSRYSNITGPHERVGLNRGNFVQFHNVNGGLIDHNKGKGGDTEDVVSLYRSSNVIVEDNHFEGTNWESQSSSGIALGDGGGSNNVARRNKLVNIGAVGIFIAGGTNNKILSNTIYGGAKTHANVGIYIWNLSSGSCSGHTMSNNKIRFVKADGTRSAYWYGGGCGTVSRSGNDFWASISLSSLRVVL
jgi:hypothetical protein